MDKENVSGCHAGGLWNAWILSS